MPSASPCIFFSVLSRDCDCTCLGDIDLECDRDLDVDRGNMNDVINDGNESGSKLSNSQREIEDDKEQQQQHVIICQR